MQFTDLGLRAEILRAVGEQGYTEPTPIQAQAIPVVLAGRDLMACAQTGTGKTAGFTLPILQRLFGGTSAPKPIKGPRVLILTPTRELAAQVEESVCTYGRHLGVRSLAMFGGVGMNPQIAAVRRGLDVLVATPGRLLDHVNQRTLDLSAVEIFVLDEADRMLDMGFIRDIRKILALLPKKRQNLLFSATFSDDIRELARGLLDDPQSVEVARRNAPAEAVKQRIYHVDKDKKRDLLLHLFDTHGWNQVLVFTRTKHGADALARKLEAADIRAAALHGNKSQGARTRALADFKSGKLVALVATDIAARGIDIDLLPYVVNYELPNIAEDYVHRIGRTGRAGAEGEAISLVCADERGYLRDIERLIKRDLEKFVLPGFEPDPNAPVSAPEPARGRQAQRPPREANGNRQERPARASRSGPGESRPRQAGGGKPLGAGSKAPHRNGTRNH